jgi:hypothetical protein
MLLSFVLTTLVHKPDRMDEAEFQVAQKEKGAAITAPFKQSI